MKPGYRNPIQDLPQEQFDFILVLLDPPDLLACSLVCRSWHEVASARVFSHVSFETAKRFCAFSTYLESYSSLRPHIRTLTLGTKPQIGEKKTAVISVDAVARIVKLLPRLSEINAWVIEFQMGSLESSEEAPPDSQPVPEPKPLKLLRLEKCSGPNQDGIDGLYPLLKLLSLFRVDTLLLDYAWRTSGSFYSPTSVPEKSLSIRELHCDFGSIRVLPLLSPLLIPETLREAEIIVIDLPDYKANAREVFEFNKVDKVLSNNLYNPRAVIFILPPAQTELGPLRATFSRLHEAGKLFTAYAPYPMEGVAHWNPAQYSAGIDKIIERTRPKIPPRPALPA
ncbi:uncharacterized protein BXZ73DRAFT_100465 [Epithele typhae]|uniref:uncharacterized protein n=1 Tax=Epithele typhae TaxID=378194 RepID=UPI002007F0D4|nr:uncharacterized protein BXZ73DRAFT_100465 [Epithele typhae]KAH9935990.1 hypothetical protein BXZ73DRAFT_100465 [Epithele typhae]